MERDVLIQALKGAGHEPIQLYDAARASLLVLPYGARVLAMFPKEKANLLWVHPSLGEPKATIEFFGAPGWRNTGGNRTWVSPSGIFT